MAAKLTTDRLVAALILLVMLGWFAMSLQLDFIVEGRPGPGFFPRWLSGLGVVLTAWILVTDFRNARKHQDMELVGPVGAPAPSDRATPEGAVVDPAREGVAVEEHDRGEFWRPLGALVALVAFILLQPVLGFQIGLLLLLLFISFVLIKMPLRLGLTVSIGTSLFIYGIFDRVFAVPFTTGIFGV